MARFVVLKHQTPPPRPAHWDLMLQFGEVLRTWALPHDPAEVAQQQCASLPDHRLAYLDFEGPISGGRGTVERCDRGTFRVEEESDGRLVVTLQGSRLKGRVLLERGTADPQRWTFTRGA